MTQLLICTQLVQQKSTQAKLQTFVLTSQQIALMLPKEMHVQQLLSKLLVTQTQTVNGPQLLASNMKIQFVQKQPSRSDQL